MIWLKNQPDAAMKIQGKLALSVRSQWVRAACDQLLDMSGRHQIGEPAEELLRAGQAKLPCGDPLLLTKFAQVIVDEGQFQMQVYKLVFTR